MSSKIVFATNVETGKEVSLDLDYAIEERISIQANSGGGKSYLVRCLAERSYGQVQQIIISPKKEFVSLREKFDYIHVGTATQVSKPDIELNVRYAEQLAIKILESGINAIIEFSEFSKERVKYVRHFIEAIVNAPEHLWHPVMIVIDEIDIWAPEKGHGEAESLGVISDLASRGRDKGFFLVAATQKLAKFNKDVASELNIKFIGKCSLDIDQSRACQELGIPLKDKGKLRELGRPNFHFYGFGSGLSDDVIKLKALPVQTTHISGYKRNKNLKPIPTPEKIKQMLQSFEGLPKEAEKEIHTKEDMAKKIREQEVTIRTLQKTQPKIDPQALDNAHKTGYEKGFNECLRQNQRIIEFHVQYEKSMMGRFYKIQQVIEEQSKSIPPVSDARQPIRLAPTVLLTDGSHKISPTPPPSYLAHQAQQDADGSISTITGLTNIERKILTAVVQKQNGTKAQIAIMNGYAPKTKGFTNPLSHLKSMGMVSYNGGAIEPTELGIQTLGEYEPLPTDHDSIMEFWFTKLSNTEIKILKAVCEYYDTMDSEGIPKDELAEKCGYAPKTKGFTNPLSHLRSLGLIDYRDSKIIPTKELYP